MLIDTLKRDIPDMQFPMNLEHQKLGDAVVFYVDQRSFDFAHRGKWDGARWGGSLASKLPYSNIFLQFKDSGLWVIESEDDMCMLAYMFFNFKEAPYVVRSTSKTMELFVIIKYDSDLNIINSSVMSSEHIKDQTIIEDMPAIGGVLTRCVTQFLMVLSCKNIRTVKIHGALKRSKHKKPLHSYYILQIADRIKSAKGKVKNIWSNRVHLCIGHIKTYTADKPLFGHYIGNVWCPPHARGNKEIGVIHKDYAL